MSRDSKNLKDLATNQNISISDISFSISYTKTNKLITALYMVTDIISQEEPIRSKLRTLGADIVSDMHSNGSNAGGKISEVVSFLNIASAMNFISEMNCSILKKEFLELRGSIQEYVDMKPTWLAEFMLHSELPLLKNSPHPSPPLIKERGRMGSIGHRYSNGHIPTRIGVQKGSTLMKALSDKFTGVGHPTASQGFDILKKQRRDNILNIIKKNNGNATIKDIRDKVNVGVLSELICSEKTLQRELLSMTRDGVLDKTGEKRWTRYKLVNLAG